MLSGGAQLNRNLQRRTYKIAPHAYIFKINFEACHESTETKYQFQDLKLVHVRVKVTAEYGVLT